MDVTLQDRLAQDVQASSPYAYCFSCLPKRLDARERYLREAAQGRGSKTERVRADLPRLLRVWPYRDAADVPARPRDVPARVSLLTDLDAFFTEHGRCGDLDPGVEGEVVWIASA
jgi:hypothetical protein